MFHCITAVEALLHIPVQCRMGTVWRIADFTVFPHHIYYNRKGYENEFIPGPLAELVTMIHQFIMAIKQHETIMLGPEMC